MDLDLRGKKALVTGATRGLGRAIAEGPASEGTDVAICARNADAVLEIVSSLKKRGVHVLGDSVDVADGEALKSWVSRSADALGGIDILVMNASAFSHGNSDSAWKAALDVDVLGAARAFEVALPHLERAAAATGDAAALFVSSIAAGETKFANSYGAMKAAQIHLAKGLAQETAARHIRVNVVSPGPIYFEGGAWQRIERDDPAFFNAYLNSSPLARMARPDEIANAVVFLVSPRASYVTGINLQVEGGYTTRVLV